MATCCSKKIETTANLVRNYLKSPISLFKERLPASRINSGILPPKRWMLELRLELRSPDLKAPTRNEVQWNQCLGIRRSRHIASCINHIPSHPRPRHMILACYRCTTRALFMREWVLFQYVLCTKCLVPTYTTDKPALIFTTMWFDCEVESDWCYCQDLHTMDLCYNIQCLGQMPTLIAKQTRSSILWYVISLGSYS